MTSSHIQRAAQRTGYHSILEAYHAIKSARDPRAIRFFLEVVRPLVEATASRYLKQGNLLDTGNTIERDDLEQQGFEALVTAIGHFKPPVEEGQDPEEACLRAWVSYASLSMKGPMGRMFLDSLGPVRIPEWAYRISSKLHAAIAEIEYECLSTGADVPDNFSHYEVARRARIPLSKVKRYLDCGFALSPSHRYDRDGKTQTAAGIEGAPLESADQPSVEEQVPALVLTNDQDKLLANVWRLIPDNQREVLQLRYGFDGDPMTSVEIAERLGISAKTVRQWQTRAMATIREYLLEANEAEAMAGSYV